jgi:predicted dehydrogenase
MRIAFIGGFGHHYLRGALTDAAFAFDRPIAFAPSDPLDDRAAIVAKSLGDVRFYDDAATMLKEYKPEIVSVGGIYARNGDMIALALEHDAAVVSDKPIAATRKQLDRIRDLTSRDKARAVLTEFDFRSRPTFRAAQQAVRDGKIGEPVLATGQKSYRFGQRPAWYKDRDLYAGTMLWVASHAIDAIRFVTGKKIVSVVGRQGNVSRPELGAMEEYVAAMMELEGGGTGLVHADYYRPENAPTHGDDRLRVAGTKGVVEVRAGRCLLIGADAGEQDITEQVQTRPMHTELIAAVRGNTCDLFSTAASIEIAEVLLAARDAADAQKWVKVS